MAQFFSYSVKTRLDRQAVWQLLADIQNWSSISRVYEDLGWSGEPWSIGSSITGKLKYPVAVPFQYLLRDVKPARLVRYLAHGSEIGFATEQTISFERFSNSTLIHVDAYAVGICNCSIVGGTLGFLKSLTESWFSEFARVCDDEAILRQVSTHGVWSVLPHRLGRIVRTSW